MFGHPARYHPQFQEEELLESEFYPEEAVSLAMSVLPSDRCRARDGAQASRDEVDPNTCLIAGASIELMHVNTVPFC